MKIISAFLLSLLCLVEAEDQKVHLLVFETDVELAQANTMLSENLPDGLQVTFVGQDVAFDGFGTKYAVTIPVLAELDPNAIAILSDARDVLVNRAAFDNSSFIVDDFVAKLTQISGGQAVVFSTEALCCVGALTYAVPGDYFTVDGRRNKRACFSGRGACLWNGDEKRVPWEKFMQDVAFVKNEGGHEEIYLNAGLMAGKAADLLRVLKIADISNEEDDQAVLTDYMYSFPEDIALDYSQSLFGSNRHDVCMFEVPEHGDRFVHIETGIAPFLIHSPGDGDNCHQAMIKVMNETLPMPDVQVSPRALRVLEDWSAEKGDNYAPTYSQIVGGIGKFCLAAEDKKASDGSRVILAKCKEKKTLLWRMDEDGKIHSKSDDSKCMVVGNGKKFKNELEIFLYPCDLKTKLNWFKLKQNGLLQVGEESKFCLTSMEKKPKKDDSVLVQKCKKKKVNHIWSFKEILA